ncbi:MAG: biopolymer transporter ExbD [Victivallales bacterium]|jgi:biopolymer transport protein ExbD|nr:biopolymer transporter ExbD [Victivallales bacterium]
MRIAPIREQEDSNSMSAMTDVVFLLLIFFIVTMSGYVEMTLLETGLPTASGASSAIDLQNSVNIEISATGDYIISGVPHSRESLSRLLRRYQRLMPDAEFLIQCDPDSKHHSLVTLLGDLARHNLKNIKLLKS